MSGLQLTESVLNHIITDGKAEESNPHGEYGRAYSDAFTIVAAAQSVVRAEEQLNRVVGAYKQL